MAASVRILFLLLSGLGVFNYVFNQFLKTSIFGYVDEALLLFSFIIFGYAILFKRYLSLLYVAVAVFLVYSVGISLAFGLSDDIPRMIGQSIINIKFFIILIAFIVLFKDHIGELRKFFTIILTIAVIGIALHLLMGYAFNKFFYISRYLRPHVRYTGFFRHPNHLAYFAVIYITLVLNTFKVRQLNISTLGWIKLALGLLVIILADTRTAMLATAILLTGFYWDYIYKNIIFFFSFIFLGLTAVFCILLFTDLPDTIMRNISMSYSLDTHYIRGLMFYMSILIFYQYFPIGTGAGTFGSYFSFGSQVYKDFGVSDRYYFVNEMGIYDSNFASILGEYGLMGIIMYYLLFKFTLRHMRFKSIQKRNPSMLKPLLWVFIFFCISNPMITNSVYIILSVVGFLLIAKTEVE